MRPVLSAILHLLLQSLYNLIWGWMGTTLLAVGIGIIRYFFAPVFDSWKSGAKVKIPKPTFGDLVTVLSSWFLLFCLSVVVTIYRDHQSLVASNKELKSSLKAITSDEVTFDLQNSIIPIEKREPEQNNWAVTVTVRANKKLKCPRLFVEHIVKKGDNSWPDTEGIDPQIGWLGSGKSFDCIDTDNIRFLLFVIFPENGKHLGLFLDDRRCHDSAPTWPCIPREYLETRDFPKGDYEVRTMFTSDSDTVTRKTFLVHWDGDKNTFHMEIAK